MHVVDTVHRMHIGAGEPIHCYVEFRHHLVVVEEFTSHRRRSWRDLVARDFITAAVDGIEQRLCEVYASAEELHLLAEPHSRYATRNAVVVAPEWPHEIIVFILQR